jgi:predicted MFS family arabinose efflux permease
MCPGYVEPVPAAAEYTSAVEDLEDASSRDAGRLLESAAAVGASSHPPIHFAATRPRAEASDTRMGLRAVCERLSRITTLARVADPERLKSIVLLALVVGLQSADAGTVGALVVSLKQSLHINDIQVGLLVTVSTGVGAIATLLAGALADRTVRVRLLWIALLVCSAAMALSAASPNYGWLLACRVGLGAGMAVSGPVVASLVGDYFRPSERGRVCGLVVAGEGTCTAMGLLVAGELGALSWRLGFCWLAVVGLVLAVAVATMLREPLRGGHSRLGDGAADMPAVAGARVLDENARRRSVWRDLRWVLSIRTNVVLIAGSSFGYFFSTGLSTFGVALLCGRFQIGQAVATVLIAVLGVGALIGVLSTGRVADWLTIRGHISARIVVGGAAFLAAAVFILPTLLTDSLLLAMVFAFLAGIALGGVNPPLNAARLDIVHSRLWGTAEAVRSTLVSISTGLAPVMFGAVSTALGQGELANTGKVAPSAASALGHTFLIMLVTLIIAAGLLLCLARRTYPRDVATAMASELLTVNGAAPERSVETTTTAMCGSFKS